MGILNAISEYRLSQLCQDTARKHQGRLGAIEDLKASALEMLFTDVRHNIGSGVDAVILPDAPLSKSYEMALERLLEDHVNYDYRHVVERDLLDKLIGETVTNGPNRRVNYSGPHDY